MAPTRRGCATCREHKIKCDRKRPACWECQKRDRRCGGYTKDLRWVDHQCSTSKRQQSQKSSNQFQWRLTWMVQDHALADANKANAYLANMHEKQLLAWFLDFYLPLEWASPVGASGTSCSWIKYLPHYHGRESFLDDSLMALGLTYLANLFNDKRILEMSHLRYSLALRKIRARYARDTGDNMLASCMVLAMYELTQSTCGGTKGWMYHVTGAICLLERRGAPPSDHQRFDLLLYRRIRTVALYHAYASQTPMIFASPDWWNKSDEPYDRLLDILSSIPGLCRKSSKRQGNYLPTNVSLLQHVLDRCRELEQELMAWYSRFQTDSGGLLFSQETVRPCLHPDIATRTSCPFEDKIDFLNANVANVLLMYWFGEVILYKLMLDLQQSLCQQKSTIGTLEMDQDVEELQRIKNSGTSFARKIYLTMASWERNGLGLVGLQMSIFPLWAATHFFSGRMEDMRMGDMSVWGHRVLDDFKKNGFNVVDGLKANFPEDYTQPLEWS